MEVPQEGFNNLGKGRRIERTGATVISVSPVSEVENESPHFRNQSIIPYQIHELKESYEDIIKFLDSKEYPVDKKCGF